MDSLHTHMAGIVFSTGAAFFWAVAIILFKQSERKFSPLALNLFKCMVTLLLLTITLAAAGIPLFPSEPLSTWLGFALSGVLGIALADTFFFMALARIGAGLTAVVDCLYLPFIMLLSFVFLKESMTPAGILGAVMVFAAILVGALRQSSRSPAIATSRRQLAAGICYGIAGILFLATSIVMVKGLLETSDVLWASFVRTLFGTLGLWLMVSLRKNRRQLLAGLLPDRAWRTALPAAIIGNYVAMIAWLAGMKYTLVSLSAILNQLSTVFVFILAALFLKEPVTGPRIVAILLATTGAIIAAVATL